MLRSFIIICILFFTLFSFAQDKEYALSCVETLSSEKFHGRGFVKKGDRIAADYIEKELKKWDAKSFNNVFQQKFKFDINTILKADVKLDTKDLELGVDYLVFAGSSTAKGNFKLYYPKDFSIVKFSEEDHKDEIFVLDTIHYKSPDLIENYRNIIATCALKNAKGVVEVSSRKLVQTQRTYEFGFSFIQVKKDAWDSTAKSININIKNKFEKDYETQNIIGYIEGEIDSFFVFGAHYDHLGRIGKDVYFPGANDNASGVATILSLAKYYHDKKIKPKYSIAFMFFGAEEAGLIGSLYYTKNPLFPLGKIKIVFNLDMVGTGVEGLSVVNGKENPKISSLIQELSGKNNFFDDVRIGKGSANSDHHFFDKLGVPSVFIFTRGGPQYYHDILDRSVTLELNKHNELINMFNLFMESEEAKVDFRQGKQKK